MARMKRAVPIAGRETQRRTPVVKAPTLTLSAPSIFVIFLAVIAVLVMIIVPLRNYMEQRSEITRLNASIAQLTERKDRMQREIEKYQSDEYVREQARIRLGVIDPGEIAFRVVDPGLENSRQTSEALSESAQQLSWYEKLWDSVSVLPEAKEEEIPDTHMPIAPDATPAAEPGAEDAPAPAAQ